MKHLPKQENRQETDPESETEQREPETKQMESETEQMEPEIEQEEPEADAAKVDVAKADAAKVDAAIEDPGLRDRSGDFGTGFLAGILATLLVAVVFLAGWSVAERRAQKRQAAETVTENGAEALTGSATLRKLDEVQSLIEKNYLGEVDSEELITYLFKGIAVGLDDVYANYYSEQELEAVLDSSRGAYTGIGAVLAQNMETKEISVKEIYEGTPAELAGLEEGDIIRKVEDTDVTDWKLDDLVTLIKGMEHPFPIEICRPETEEILTLEIALGEIRVPAVSYEMKEDGIGYIRIAEFTGSAVDQFISAADALEEQGMTSLIVDLRDNPGGLLTSVCDILDEVVPEGLLVYTEDKDGNREEYHSDRKRSVDCRTAVLVNGNSASASEIFAGAIQDYAIGPVIGTTTFGKGVVQKTFPLSDGSAFKMTVEKYYTPLGQDIDGNGITPDIVVADTDRKAQDGQETDVNNPDEQKQDGQETDANNPDTKKQDEQEPDGKDSDENASDTADPVLSRAMEVLRNPDEEKN